MPKTDVFTDIYLLSHLEHESHKKRCFTPIGLITVWTVWIRFCAYTTRVPPGRNPILFQSSTQIIKVLATRASEPKPPSQWKRFVCRRRDCNCGSSSYAFLYRSVMLWLGIGCVFLRIRPIIPSQICAPTPPTKANGIVALRLSS